MKLLKRLCACYSKCGQWIGAAIAAPTQVHVQLGLIVCGIALLFLGLESGAIAATNGPDGLEIEADGTRFAQAANVLLEFIEGPFGALVMVASGLGAILSCAFGQYKAALNCLVVAVGSFILKSLLRTFFNTDSLDLELP